MATAAAILMLSIILSVMTALAAPLAQTTQVTVTVADTDGAPQTGLRVYAFNGATYTNLNGTTDTNGQATFDLPDGSYNFRADLNNTQFFSGGASGVDTCTVDNANPNCTADTVTVTIPVVVTVVDTNGVPQTGVPVYAFNGATYTNKNATTDANGQVSLTLLPGDYNFRADVNGTQFFSGGASGTNTCTIPGCTTDTVTVTVPVVVTVADTYGAPQAGLPVYVFNGATYTNKNATTDASGQVSFSLPAGDYNFRADLNNTQFFSGGASGTNTCTTPGCTADTVTVTTPVLVTVEDSAGTPQVGAPVYAYNGTTYANKQATTDANGQASLTLLPGNYNFRADVNGTQFFSGGASGVDTCQVNDPNQTCTADTVTAAVFGGVVVTVADTYGAPQAGLPVYVFNGATYTNKNATTDASGQVSFSLPAGDYNFRADLNNTQFFSGGASGTNTCTTPGCTADTVTVTTPVLVTVEDSAGTPQVGAPVYAYNGTTYANKQATTDANGQASLTLLPGNYNFRADVNGTQFFSGGASGVDTCQVNDPNQTCTADTVTVPAPAAPQADLSITKTIDKAAPASGDTIVYTLSIANSGPDDATGVLVTDTLPLSVTYGSDDSGGAYNGSTWSVGSLISGTTATLNITATVNAAADGTTVTNTADVSGNEADPNPGNNTANIDFTVTNPLATTLVTVTVTSANGAAVPNQQVKVYTLDTNTGITSPTTLSNTTNISGAVTFNLAAGDYVFIADDANGARYSSAACAAPACANIDLFLFSVIDVTVTDATGAVVNQVVYVFDDLSVYQNISGTTTLTGTVSFNLDSGNYMFYTYDGNGVGYGSVPVPCTAPGCTAATITMPVFGTVAVTVTNGVNTLPGKQVQVYTVDATSGVTTATSISNTTNISGTVNFSLAQGSYQFAANDALGATFFSPTCDVPACASASVVLGSLHTVTVTVQDNAGALLPNQIVYALDSAGATAISATTTISGTVNFSLPAGDYTFAADSAGGARYFSPLCTLPGCTDALIILPASAVTLPAATCTESGGVRTCDLWATAGTLTLPDGNTVDIWGYTDTDPANGGTAQLPGPMIIANQGETIEVILHNDLPNNQATALLFKGLNIVPDLNGVSAGGSKTYSFNATAPGTFLYQAGLTGNGTRQLAMGLYGALIIRPVTGGSPVLNQAYGSSASRFDDETLLVLSEIDPSLNANPTGFDLNDFKPQYWLINGQAFPQTGLIQSLAGHKVLLRYLNAGLEYHSMGVLGLSQTKHGVDGNPLPGAHNIIAESLAPGQTMDAIVSVPAATEQDTRFALYDTNLLLHNAGSDSLGGMLTFLATLPDGTTRDPGGPATTEVTLTPSSTASSVPVDITAQVTDASNGGDNIQGVEFFVGSPGGNGAGTALSPADGGFDSPMEDAQGTIPASVLAGLSSGNYTIYVHGQDDQGNWGPFHPVVLHLDKDGPATTGLALTPNPGGGSGHVALTGTADDRFSGNSDVTAARYSVDGGAATSMTLNVTAPIASLSAIIDVTGLSAGVHTVAVESQDAFGHWGPAAAIDLMIDQTGPDTLAVVLLPDANNGTLPVNASLFSMRVNATISDPATIGVQSNIKAVEGFINYQPGVDQDGTGFPLTPADGGYNSPVEDAYAFIPLSTINALAEGAHTIGIHGQDASGNWGAVVNAQLIIDKVLPTVSGLTATPNPTNGAGASAIAATATDATTSIALAEWFVGADPGAGNGTPMAVAFNGANWDITSVIDVAGWADGDYNLSVRARDAAGNWSAPVSITLSVSDAPTPPADQVYFSTVGGGNANPIPNVAGPYDDADIYHWDGAVGGNAFTRFFDSTANGLPGNADIDGLKTDGTVYYMSFSRNQGTNIPGLGSVEDEDIVLYDTENGEWDFLVTGADSCVGTTNGHDIDALDVVGGVVYFSTVGNSSITGVPGPYDDADIYAWNGGDTCERVFDAVGPAGNLLPGYADIDGLTVVDGDTFYMSFNSATTNITGLGAVQDEDIVLYDKGVWTLFFDGGAHGLANSAGQDLDAIDVK